MKVYTLFFLLLFPLITSAEDKLHFQFGFGLVNDNPFLNLIPAFETEDDTGHTHGLEWSLGVVVTCGLFAENERWQLKLKSDLYTSKLPQDEYDAAFPNVPQKFFEDNELMLQWDNIFAGNKFYYVIGGGLGLANDQEAKRILPFSAIGSQTAWHEFKHTKTPDRTPLYQNEKGATYKYFGKLKAAVGTFIEWEEERKQCLCEIDYLKTEMGTEIMAVKYGSYVYFLVAANKSFWRHRQDHFLSVTGTFHSEAYNAGRYLNLGFTAEAAYHYSSGKISTGMDLNNSKGNLDYIRYNDKDPIWNLNWTKKW